MENSELQPRSALLPPKRLLAVFAHPDDETFGSGSILAKYADEGVEVVVVCATRGEAGEIAPNSEATKSNLGEVRSRELRSALSLLGVKEGLVLGYRDSGMAGSVDNSNPAALINVPAQDVENDLIGIMLKFKPHVVLTMEETGAYGHPDHIKMTEITTNAFHRAVGVGVPALDSQERWRPDKLYYQGWSRRMLMNWQEHFQKAHPDSDIAKLDPRTLGTPDEAFTTVVDVSQYGDLRLRAVNLYRSQISPFASLPEEFKVTFLKNDSFVRVQPPWEGGPLETDLFQ